ncbi:aldo/keto reductase [Paenarthrobacter sp. AT5]|uniref:aldo/keto reductase n=1 Tax=Paenarthrobacter TaxID=1742992 RepID=UPI001A98EF3D|nr:MULTISPECIES: aldo/keto reductase [Paenarthrobacter]QSZ54323.1 alcohol dehydrogenase [Paenarthrobacter ureafaciens]WOC59275.1 aldo/keto reductase [Paenarthrobacter sp. AT5]
MKYRKIGNSGLEVSAVTLGCMSYGDADRGNHGWTLPEEESRSFIKNALELGITTFDTANIYSIGSSEEILGRALKDFAKREEVVVATKVHGTMRPGPNGGGLSRGHIMEQIDASLRRLGTEYVDLYQIHRFDPAVPIEETLEALHDVVKSGKARYIGASSMWAWQFAKLQYTAKLNGWTQFISMQSQYNLLTREDERELHPFCVDQGVGLLPWSPLARGKLARPWDVGSERVKSDPLAQVLYQQFESEDRKIADQVGAIAEERGASRSQVALAWLLHRPGVSSPIIGATKPNHLEDAVRGVDLELSDDEMRRLEENYVPHAVEGF